MALRTAVLTTSYPAFAGDACGLVEAEARRLATQGEVFVVTASHRHDDLAPDPTPEPTLRDLFVLRLEGHGAFGWPGMGARVRARPHLGCGAARWAFAAKRALRALAPLDRIVAHWALPCAWPICGDRGAPLEVVSHGADVRLLLGLPAPLRRAVVERVVRRSEVWRFVSLRLFDSLSAALDAKVAQKLGAMARIEACPIEIPDVRAATLEHRARSGGLPLAVCVGRLVPSKAVERVIDFVATRLASGTRLVVVGEGPLRSRLEARARARRVDALFVGQTTRRDALAWIGAADMVLHASLAEGLSTVEREARALGVPFVFAGREGVPPLSVEGLSVPSPLDVR